MAQPRGAAKAAGEPSAPHGWRAFMVGFCRMNDYSRQFWRNRLSAWFTDSEWFHAELYFPVRDGGMFGVTAKDPVDFYGRLSSRERYGADWEWHVMAVPPATYARLLRWCQDRVRRGAQFDSCGFLCFMCPSMLDPGGNRYLCSGLTAHALVASGVLAHARLDRPAATAPNALRDLVLAAPQDQALRHWTAASFVDGEQQIEATVPRPAADAPEPVLSRTRRERERAAAPAPTRWERERAAAAAPAPAPPRPRYRVEVAAPNVSGHADTVLSVETSRARDAQRFVGWMMDHTPAPAAAPSRDDDDEDPSSFFADLLGGGGGTRRPVHDV